MANDTASYSVHFGKLALAFIPFATILGNLLVIVSVATVRSLRIRINYLILALAVTDLLLAAFVMPFAVYVEFNGGTWPFDSMILCDIYLSCDVTVSTASIFILALISYDRFQAATNPLEYANNRKSTTRLLAAVLTCWFCSGTIAVPIVVGINNYEGRERIQICQFNDHNFMLISGLVSFYIPTVIILALYYRIFRVIRERGRLQRERAKLSALPAMVDTNDTEAETLTQNNNTPERKVPCNAAPQLLAVTIQVEIPHIRIGQSVSFQERAQIAKFDADDTILNSARACSLHSCLTDASSFSVLDEDIHFIDQSPMVDQKDTPIAAPETFETPDEDKPKFEMETISVPERVDGPPTTKTRLTSLSSISSRRGTTSSNLTSSLSFDVTEPRNRAWAQLLLHGAEIIATASTALFSIRHTRRRGAITDDTDDGITVEGKRPRIRFSSRRKTLRRKVAKANKKERKATKTLAVVLGVYLLCWCPFFVTGTTNAICLKLNLKSCEPSGDTFFLTTWLGYMNSFMNPVIYTIFSDEFRRAFKQVICRRKPRR